MGDYTSLFAGCAMLSDEYTYPNKLQVSVDGDSLGMITIKFGSSMTLRLDSESADKLVELIIEGDVLASQLQKYAEDQRKDAQINEEA